MNDSSFTIINPASETFTTTHSGAIATWNREILSVAARRGERPVIITRSSPHEAIDWPETITVDYPTIPRNRYGAKALAVWRDIQGWSHLREGRFNGALADIVRDRGLASSPILLHNAPELAVFLRSRFPRTIILHLFHGHNTCAPRFRNRFGGAVSLACAVSQYTAGWNAAYFGTRVRSVLNGVDIERFRPAPETRQRRGRPVVNFVGLTDARKGPDLLLEACLLVSQRTSEFAVQILGSNRYGYSEPDAFGRRLAGLAAELRARGVDVEMPGFVVRSELPRWLSAAAINVVPSRIEDPITLTVLEGMASGLATVVADIGGLPEAVADSGLIFPSGDADALAAHLIGLIEDPDRLSLFRRQARARAEALSWDRTYSRICELFDLAASGRLERQLGWR